MTPKILCCGEALIDMLPRTATDGGDAFAPHPGGAVFNTAIALGRLGQATGFFSGLSNDLFGARLSAALADSGVDASQAHRSERPTTLAFVTLTEGQASYAFYDENTAGRMLSEADLPEVSEDTDALFFGGISLAVDPCASAYTTLLERVSATRLVMCDPNIRPSFVSDEPAFRARLERVLAHSDVVKLSDEDLHWIAGAGDLETLAREILAKGPKVVCITEGSKGVTAYTSGGAVSVAATPVEVVDTVGAGDTFNAGFLAGLAEAGALSKSALAEAPEAILSQALSLGTKAAAITVSRAGANPPTRAEI